MSMVGMVLRKTATVLLTILKWMLQAVLMLLKLVLGIAKLFLLLLALAARVDSKTVPVAACTGCKGGTHNGWSYGRQTVRGLSLPICDL